MVGCGDAGGNDPEPQVPSVCWSINNRPVSGGLSQGDITTTFYSPAPNNIYILGAENLDLHADKTRALKFKPGVKLSLNFLGFTHFWKKSHRGKWCVGRKTMESKFANGVKAINQWCKFNRHLTIADQHRMLYRKVRGHYAYYGLSGNVDALRRFRQGVERIWIKWLRRRSQKYKLNWGGAKSLLKRFKLPMARMVRENHLLVRVIV